MSASRAAADRLEEARTAWAAAYHERERAVLEEFAIVEDSRIEIVMGSRAQLPWANRAALRVQGPSASGPGAARAAGDPRGP